MQCTTNPNININLSEFFKINHLFFCVSLKSKVLK